MNPRKGYGFLESKVWFSNNRRDIVAKNLTRYFGSIWFLFALLTLVLGWMAINSGYFGSFKEMDPYPFVLLVMIVQLFEVFLSVIVLISQNRQGDNAEVRQQIDFEINVRAEKEITKILHMLDEIRSKLGILKEDVELANMKEQIDIKDIKEVIEQNMQEEKSIQN